MAKKKKKPANRLSNDVRGYATTNTTSPSPSTAVLANSTVPLVNIPFAKGPFANSILKTAAIASTTSSASRIQITSDIQQTMEDLLCALHNLHQESKDSNDASVATTLPPLTSLRNTSGTNDFNVTKLRRRLGVIYDSLTEYGFDFDQIREAVTACSTNVTLTQALDWLCYYIPTPDLPSLFTEGLIRDTESKKNNDSIGVTVIRAPNASSMVAKDISPSTELFLTVSPAEKKDLVMECQNLETAKSQDDKWSCEHKAMLLARYEFATNLEDEDELQSLNDTNFPDKSVAIDGYSRSQNSSSIQPTRTDLIPGDTKATECMEFEQTSSNDVILRLEAMRCELSAIEDDLRNEANNYMRSKDEIKDLKQKANNLRKAVGSLEAKSRRQKSYQNRTVESIIHDELEDDSEVGLFSIFDEEADDDRINLHQESTNTPTVSSTSQARIYIPDDSIPPGWTGKTPKVYLEELCRKEKCPKPIFEKLSLNGCRLLLKRKTGTMTWEESGVHTNFTGLQHYLSTKALYEITPALPLYRLFPPFYRDLWISWINSEKQEMIDQSDLLANRRNEKIDELVHCISRVLINDSDNSELSRFRYTEKRPQPSVDVLPNLRKSSITDKQHLPTSKGSLLQEEFFRRKESFSYISMQSARIKLPIYGYRELILDTIQKNPVTILCAETGSGKTTQCGSFILEQSLHDGKGDRISILCTQPRRVAAMSVAERVATELGESNVGKLVGYQIRMEARRSSDTRLLFCTTGVILRRLIEDPELKGISHVLVDEVHERQWQIDVLLVALRALITGTRPDLKLVLMSATLDAKLFGTFFMGAPLVNVPGRTFPVRIFYLEDLLEKTNHVIDEASRFARRGSITHSSISIRVTSRGGERRNETIDYESYQDSSDDFPGYSEETKRSIGRVDERVINYDLIEDILDELLLKNSNFFVPHLEFREDSTENEVSSNAGAVLIFLPGLEEIRTLMERLLGSRRYGNAKQFEIVPLHSRLSSLEQKRAFLPSPPGCRKIVISTNVAETSVTIPDVVYVIDSGRVREITRDKKTNARKLVETWCSKASAKQRSGRAGRVQPGACLKLYSSRTESQIMREATTPELLRMPLEEVCLTILAGRLGKNCSDFLSQAPQAPSNDAVQSAINVLEDIGAITTDDSLSGSVPRNRQETLTSLGYHLAKLPVDARVGKMLILGTLFKCTDAILTIAASLSASKSPFLSKIGDRHEMASLHSQFFHPLSDFLTYVNLWNAYKHAEAEGKGKGFCRQKFLNYTAMREIQYARLHYIDLLCGLGFLDLAGLRDETDERNFDEKFKSNQCNRNSNFELLVHAVIYAGLYPNVAYVNRTGDSGDFTVLHKTEHLFIQSPVTAKLNISLPSSWITFYEKFGTERRVSISKIAFISTISLMLFSSKLHVLHTKRKVIVDDWIEISAAAKTGVVFQEFQNRFAEFLSLLFDNGHENNDRNLLSKEIDNVIDLIVTLLSKG